jgi:hypothetical protein
VFERVCRFALAWPILFLAARSRLPVGKEEEEEDAWSTQL